MRCRTSVGWVLLSLTTVGSTAILVICLSAIDVSNVCSIGVHGIGLSLYVSWDSTELSSKYTEDALAAYTALLMWDVGRKGLSSGPHGMDFSSSSNAPSSATPREGELLQDPRI